MSVSVFVSESHQLWHNRHRRANFTSANMRESDFSGSNFTGAYMEKAVAYKANFTGNFNSIDEWMLWIGIPFCNGSTFPQYRCRSQWYSDGSHGNSNILIRVWGWILLNNFWNFRDRFWMKRIWQMLFLLEQFSHAAILVVQSLKVLILVTLLLTSLKNRWSHYIKPMPVFFH